MSVSMLKSDPDGCVVAAQDTVVDSPVIVAPDRLRKFIVGAWKLTKDHARWLSGTIGTTTCFC